MNSKNKFKIGEFSKLNRITVKTLRHYEIIGLLKPNEIDEWTGYRYYDVSQFRKVSIILYLKKLGFSLSEIREMFDDGLEYPPTEMIMAKIESCRQGQAFLKWQLEELMNLENHIQGGIKMEKVFIKTLPAITVASFRKVIKDYGELSYLCCNVIGPEMQRCGCKCDNLSYCYTVEHDKEHKVTDIDVEYCEAVDSRFQESDILKCRDLPEVKTAVCINHLGSYHNFQQSVAILVNYIEENGYKIIDYPRFSYIDGPWNKENESEYLSEIQFPVALA